MAVLKPWSTHYTPWGVRGRWLHSYDGAGCSGGIQSPRGRWHNFVCQDQGRLWMQAESSVPASIRDLVKQHCRSSCGKPGWRRPSKLRGVMPGYKGFGSPAEHHRRAAIDDLRQANLRLLEADRFLELGDCQGAQASLMAALGFSGSCYRESRHAGLPGSFCGGNDQYMGRLQHNFRNLCKLLHGR